MPRASSKPLRCRALRIEQDPQHPVYLFTLSGADLLRIADVSRLSRNDAGSLIGYQRPEVKKHVREIVEYIDSGPVLFPNSIILALSSRVSFVRSRGPQVQAGLVSAGTLEIPAPTAAGTRPAWVVDGQQRFLALSMAKRQHFPVPISGFVADDVDIQRDQFLRVNNTKPLPRGLITELLPEVQFTLPTRLAVRRIPAILCERLALDPSSPFRGLIRRPSTQPQDRAQAVVADTSLVKTIQGSLSSSSGCLFPYRNIVTGETDMEGIWAILKTYWSAVRETFPEAWGKPPSESRLMHGAGIQSMGRLMDRIMSFVDPRSDDARRRVGKELSLVAPSCHWTGGDWDGMAGMHWDEVQNVSRHIKLLSSYLIRTYLQAREAST